MVQVLVKSSELLGVVVLKKDLGLADLPVLEAQFLQDFVAALFTRSHLWLQRID